MVCEVNGLKPVKLIMNMNSETDLTGLFACTLWITLANSKYLQKAPQKYAPYLHFNSLPDDKILDRSKFKQIADNIFEVHLKWKISVI